MYLIFRLLAITVSYISKVSLFSNKNSDKNSTKTSQLKNKILVSRASYRIQSRILVGFPFSQIEIFRVEIFCKHENEGVHCKTSRFATRFAFVVPSGFPQNLLF